MLGTKHPLDLPGQDAFAITSPVECGSFTLQGVFPAALIHPPIRIDRRRRQAATPGFDPAKWVVLTKQGAPSNRKHVLTLIFWVFPPRSSELFRAPCPSSTALLGLASCHPTSHPFASSTPALSCNVTCVPSLERRRGSRFCSHATVSAEVLVFWCSSLRQSDMSDRVTLS